MRLFIAIDFSDEIKSALNEIIDKLHEKVEKGRFTKPEHLHLTLEFLGEIENSQSTKIIDYVKNFKFNEFVLETSSLGTFKQKLGQLIFLDIKKSDALFDIQRRIHSDLKEMGLSSTS